MKKTLIALAVLAASSVSFAQVTITGAFQTGYQAVTDGKLTQEQADALITRLQDRLSYGLIDLFMGGAHDGGAGV